MPLEPLPTKGDAIFHIILGILLLLCTIGFAIIALSTDGGCDQWEPRHVNKEILWQGLNFIDILQSDNIAENPDEYREIGIPRFFWGVHPSRIEMVGTMIVYAGVHLWLTDIIPKKSELFGIEWHPRDFFQDFTIGLTSATIFWNYSVGL